MSKTNSPLYYTWRNMVARCTKQSHPSYKNYGGRGINVCQEWLDNFEAFEHDMGEKPHGLTLERKNNNDGYSKENCMWADRKTQNTNRRKQPSKYITANGVTRDINEWSSLTSIKRATIYQRLHRGWSPERALRG